MKIKNIPAKNDSFSSETILHKPVLINEVIEYLNIKPNQTYIDVTFGCGGHSRAILEKESTCKVIALDWDRVAIDNYGQVLEEEFGERFKIIWGNFGALYKLLKKEKITKADGILADFGTSQVQIHTKEGLSFQKDTPLDMRMSTAHHYFSAYDIVNRFSEKHIAEILWTLGEERNSRKIATAIVEFRKRGKISTTGQLVEIIESTLPYSERFKKTRRIHPATKTFQALRIFVNKELENIQKFLPQTISFLNQGGRLVCISFHSLEDRLVKTFLKNHQNELLTLTKKPITASQEELNLNKSARSAKLRVGEKI